MKQFLLKLKIKNLVLLAILIAGLWVRLYKIDSPIADWHSWRQADTASVTRIFEQQGVNLLIPRFQDISATTTGQDNPQGYRMVEYPFYNLAHLGIYQIHPSWGIDQAGRITSVILSLISIILLFLIVEKLSGTKTALLAAFLMAFLPFNIYYSRVVLPEPMMIAAFLASFYFFLQLLKSQNKNLTISLFLLSFVNMAIAILIKPYAVFFTLPFFYLAYLKWGFNLKKNKYFYLFITACLLPFALWRLWILQFPEGIPGASWLFNYMGIRFRPAWFRWLFGERLGFLILGIWGVLPFVLGVIKKSRLKKEAAYPLFFIGIIAYFAVIAGGNVTHDYYQAIIMPFVAMIMARGISVLVSLPPNKFSRFGAYIAAIFIVFFSIGYSWYQIKGYYQINNYSIVDAGRAADKILPPDAKVVAPYNGDTAFLYQTNRFGWPIIQGDIKTMVSNLKATHYVSVNYDDATNQILGVGEYETVEKTPQYVIVKLRYPNP